ncbi:MAG TPA: DnaA regulatory inactivator HdaA [Ensifer sp.]|nr:DnaA regulatory inactivator HdaA [Ensifer sp.]
MARNAGDHQLPLEFPIEEQTSRDDLRVADPLKAAVRIVDGWPNWPSPVVILVGPVGCGKSHLASIWRENARAVSIDATVGSAAAMQAARHPVLFEDVDRRPFDDTELFHVINSVRENGTSLLMTARTSPLVWDVSLADLKSRLKAATVVEIGEPDEELLAEVLMKLFSDRQIVVEDKLIAYIAARMERSTEAARRIVDTLDRLALSRRTKINRALVAEVLSAFEEEDDRDSD